MIIGLWVLVAVVALVTGHTAVNVRLLRRPEPDPSIVDFPVSVLLPVRDEAHRIRSCVESLLTQTGVPELEIIVLDDGSSDGTAEVIRAVVGDDTRVRLITGSPVPPGWLGKPYACHQLATAARQSSQVFAFVDADVVLAPGALAAAVGLLRPPGQRGFDLVSPYPRIVASGLGQRLVQPLLQWSWLSFLPLRAMEHSPRASLAAAGGQFLLVSRDGYAMAGGHAAVADKVLEDIELARAVKRRGGRIALADGSTIATCHMYGSWPELVHGYSKSLWASFGSPIGAAAVVSLLLLLYAVPAAVIIVSTVVGAWAWVVGALVAYVCGVAGRALTGRASGARVWPDALAHPASIVLFGWLVARSYAHHRRGDLSWKGRPVG